MGAMNCKEYKTNNAGGGSGDKRDQSDTGTVGMFNSTVDPSPIADYEQQMVVCHEKDLAENEMKSFDFLNDSKVLIVKQRGKIYALGSKCTHYGAPLVTGVLGEGRVRCPWHGACFNIENGDIEDFPGLDSLPCYRTQVVKDTGEVKVYALKREIGQASRIKKMAEMKPRDERVFMVVGGGPAAAVCVETLRQENYTGRIVMIIKDKYLPYDRIKISKAMDVPIETLLLREQEFYDKNNIEVKLQTAVTKLDSSHKTVTLSDNTTMAFDKIFIATGCTPIRPPIPGIDLANIFTIRFFDDGANILGAIKRGTHVVCLGSSFIALEAAAYLAGKVESVTIISRTSTLLLESFGKEVGDAVLQLFEKNNVKIIPNSGIIEVINDGTGAVGQVKLKDETIIPCNLMVLGTGARVNTEFLKDTGIMMQSNGSVNTDLHLMTNVTDIYVGGDISNAPIHAAGNERYNIGHYQLAQYHGRIAALNMVDQITQLNTVPFFFTMLFGKGIRYAGCGKHTNVYIDGNLDEFKFVAYYLDPADFVIAVASCGRDPLVSAFAELMYQGKRLHLNEIDENSTWTEKIHKGNCS